MGATQYWREVYVRPHDLSGRWLRAGGKPPRGHRFIARLHVLLNTPSSKGLQIATFSALISSSPRQFVPPSLDSTLPRRVMPPTYFLPYVSPAHIHDTVRDIMLKYRSLSPPSKRTSCKKCGSDNITFILGWRPHEKFGFAFIGKRSWKVSLHAIALCFCSLRRSATSVATGTKCKSS